jgi:hypothetical protein
VKRKMPVIKQPAIEVRDVDIGFPTLVVTNSNSLRVTIPRRACEMYGIEAGDQVQVKIIRISRTERKQFEDNVSGDSRR